MPTVHEEEGGEQRRAKPATTADGVNNNGCSVEATAIDREAERETLPSPQGDIDSNAGSSRSPRRRAPPIGAVGSFSEDDDDSDDDVEAIEGQEEETADRDRANGEEAAEVAAGEGSKDITMLDADLAAPDAHAARPVLPGPFVVFQGVPGDGMANYLDSMPLLEYHGSQPGSRHGSRRGSFNRESSGLGASVGMGMDVGGSFMEVDEEDPCEGDSSDLSDEVAALPSSGISSERSSSSSTSSSSSSSASSFPRQIAANSPSRESSGGSPGRESAAGSDGSFQQVGGAEEGNDGGVLAFGSSSSGGSGAAASAGSGDGAEEGAAAAAAVRSQPSRAALEGRTTEGGLHLPIPPTMGCGGSVLPPLGSPNRDARSRPRVVSQAEEGAHDEDAAMMPPPPPVFREGAAASESFVVVRDDMDGDGNDGGGASTAPPAETGMSENALQRSSSSGGRRRRSRRRSSSADASTQTPTGTGSSSHSRSGGLNRTERRAVRRWNAERLERERRQREETVLDGYGYGVRRIGVGPRAATVSEATEEWWARDGRLAVFESMPRLDAVGGDGAGASSSAGSPGRSVRVAHARVVSTLPPGATVLASRLITVDSATFDPVPDALQSQGPLGCLRFLEISSPVNGYVLYGRDDGHSFLGPGLPGNYADPEVWPWRVTCPDGALIREGLELTTAHVETVPHGSLVRVTRKTVNSMGLSRLRVEAVLPGPSSGASPENDGGDRADGEGGGRKVVGWISEALNPLSGQRGPVVQPLPFPVPVRYRVRLPEGAVVRSDVELSSAQIGHAPCGSILTVVGRAFSEHPMDQCVERLRLAGGRGWVSVRLNRAPPLDETVVELVGLDGEYDPDEAGAWHIKERRGVMEELRQAQEQAAAAEAAASATHAADSTGSSPTDASGQPSGVLPAHLAASVSARLMRRTLSAAELSSIPDDESDLSPDGAAPGGPADPAMQPIGGMAAMPTLFRGGYTGGVIAPSFPTGPNGGCGGLGASMSSAGSGGMMGPSRTETCLICLTEERNSTIVHGGTGHIACCLTCARILKARGDRCPVCRLPIDSVIQQFWA